jgi:isopenicillin-N N-acyltransferase-like protein
VSPHPEISKNSTVELLAAQGLKIVPPNLIEEHPQAKLPLVRLTGSPQEIGAEHGTKLSDRIEKAFELYRAKLFSQWTDASLKATSLAFFERIQEFSQQYALELQAIASGAGRSLWEIVMLMSRTEILCSSVPNECTSLYFKQSRILGQNWDWVEEFENLAVIFDVTRQDGFRFVALGEPGFVKIGLNTSGIGVCLNILKCQASTGGIPVHILLRKVLDSTSVNEAYHAIAAAERTTMSNILIADDSGKYVNLELAGNQLFTLDSNEVEVNNVVVHTNGFLTSKREKIDFPEESESSAARIVRAKSLTSTQCGQNEADMLRILLDQEGNLPICRQSERNIFDGLTYGTVSTVVMNLRERKLIFSQGNPRKKTFSYVSILKH